MEIARCPVCEQGRMSGSGEFCMDYISGEIFTLMRCDRCGSAKTHNLSPSETSRDYYGKEYYNSADGKFSPIIEWIFSRNHRRNAREIAAKFQPERVLEVGCGRAYLLKELAKHGVDVGCLESSTAADWILNNKDVRVTALRAGEQAWPFPAEYFDLIIYWHVFEHLDDPLASLEQATGVLKKGKNLCISVPNGSSIQARIKPAAWFHLDVPRHLYHFSKNGLIEMLIAHGYEIKQVVAGDAIQNLYGWFQTLANLFTPKHPNSLYRFLQGGEPRRTASKLAIAVQLFTAFFWIPVGLLGYLLETITGMHGNITIYAAKENAGKSTRLVTVCPDGEENVISTR